MPRAWNLARIWARNLVQPSLQSDDDPLIGGQAVMEGVMMRTPKTYCVAVRKPSGEIVTKEESATRLSERNRFWKLPIARGCGVLGQSMAIGMKALNYSAEQAVEEEGSEGAGDSGEIPGWMLWVNIAISLGFFILMYKFLPLVATRQVQEWQPVLDNQVGFSVVEGVIRLLIFLGFLLALSRMKDIRRVFEYHGAEHKVVFNFESGQDLSVANAQRFVTFHPRCGTSFLMVVMVVAIAVYALVPFDGFGTQFLARLALLPIIAGVSYEILRYSAKHQDGIFMLMARPGLWLQRITTKEPDDGQVEVAIHALEKALDLERRVGGQPVIA